MTYFKSWQKNKYGNKPQVVDGIRYDSGLEGQRASELALLEKAKEIRSWERQKTMELRVNGYLVCRYRVDFVVHHWDGTTEYEEVKGFFAPTGMLKWKLFEALMSKKKNVKLTLIT